LFGSLSFVIMSFGWAERHPSFPDFLQKCFAEVCQITFDLFRRSALKNEYASAVQSDRFNLMMTDTAFAGIDGIKKRRPESWGCSNPVQTIHLRQQTMCVTQIAQMNNRQSHHFDAIDRHFSALCPFFLHHENVGSPMMPTSFNFHILRGLWPRMRAPSNLTTALWSWWSCRNGNNISSYVFGETFQTTNSGSYGSVTKKWWVLMVILPWFAIYRQISLSLATPIEIKTHFWQPLSDLGIGFLITGLLLLGPNLTKGLPENKFAGSSTFSQPKTKKPAATPTPHTSQFAVTIESPLVRIDRKYQRPSVTGVTRTGINGRHCRGPLMILRHSQPKPTEICRENYPDRRQKWHHRHTYNKTKQASQTVTSITHRKVLWKNTFNCKRICVYHIRLRANGDAKQPNSNWENLKDRLASAASERSAVQKRAIFGTVKITSVSTITVSNQNQWYENRTTDNITFFQNINGKRTKLTNRSNQ